MRRNFYFLGAFLLILAAFPAHAKVLHVEKWGQDSTYCGAAADPCATINQAIDNADPGNTIRVGPGVYGDADGDGVFSGPGEESRQCRGWASVICVDKDHLKLESTTGAAHTVINGNVSISAGVCLVGKGVTFGGKKRGFAVRHAGKGVVLYGDRLTVQYIRAEDNTAFGFYCEQFPGWGHHVLVGNTAVRSHSGFYLRETTTVPLLTLFAGNRIRDNNDYGVTMSLRNAVTVKDNVIEDNNRGFSLQAGGGSLLKNNLATGNHDFGFAVTLLGKGSLALIGNSASHNGGDGFHLNSVTQFLQNVSTDNGVGLDIRTSSGRIVKNTISGNRYDGIVLTFPGAVVRELVIEKNNLFENGWGSGTNCGLNNQMARPVTVRRNFWGDPAGPGPDPADNTCGDPVTELSPASKPIKVKVKAPAL